MEGYMTTKEAAEKWGVSVRQVQNYCKKDIIPDVKKVGTNYLIPKEASRPRYVFLSEKSKRETAD